MLKNIAVDTVGELAANKVGASRPQDGYWTHKLKHGLVEGGLGAVLRYDDDPVKGFVAGAAGAIVSEVIAEGMSKNIGNETFAAYEVDCQQEGILPTKEGYQAAFRKRLDVAKDVARLGGAVAGAVAGDVSIGSRMANNAIDNNFARNNEELVQEACEIVWMAHETKDILQKQGHVSAFGRLGIKIETSADGKVIFKAADDSTFNSAKEALDHVLSDIPNLRASLGDVTKELCAFGDIVVDEAAKEGAKTAAREAGAPSAPAAIQTGDVLAQMMDGGGLPDPMLDLMDARIEMERGRQAERQERAPEQKLATSRERLKDTPLSDCKSMVSDFAKKVKSKVSGFAKDCHEARDKWTLESSVVDHVKAVVSSSIKQTNDYQQCIGASMEVMKLLPMQPVSSVPYAAEAIGDVLKAYNYISDVAIELIETGVRRGLRAVTGSPAAGQDVGEIAGFAAGFVVNPDKVTKALGGLGKLTKGLPEAPHNVPSHKHRASSSVPASLLPTCSSSSDAKRFVASQTTKKNVRVTREARWIELANDPNTCLPKEVVHHINKHRGRGVSRIFGLELAHKPKQSAISGYDYSEALPKTIADHRGLEHRFLKERKTGTVISKPKTSREKSSLSLPKPGKLPK